MSNASYVNAGARLDRLPTSKFHWRMLMMIGAGLFLDGFDIFLAGSVLPALIESRWSTLAQNADFISVTFIGMVVGSWCAGVLGDKFGRRVTYQANLLIFGLASLAGALAPSMTWLIVARLIMGVGLGAEVVVSYAMLNEFMPRKQRGRWGASLVTISTSSMVVSSLIGYAIVPVLGWRWMFAIVGVGALLVTYLRKNLPESPRWLESKRRNREAEAILQAIEMEVGATHSLPAVQHTEAPVTHSRSFLKLFSRSLLGRTIVGTVTVVCMSIVLWGFVSWIPTFLVQHGVSVAKSIGYTVLMAVGAPLGSVLPAFVADRIGRKRPLVFFSVLGMCFVAAYPYADTPILITLTGFGVVLAASAISSLTFGIYIPELFPTDLRMRGAGLCITVGRLATAASSYAILAVYQNFQLHGVALMMVVLLAVLAIVVGLWGLETKAKSLEELGATSDGESLRLGDPAPERAST